MGLWTQSTAIHNVDKSVPHHETPMSSAPVPPSGSRGRGAVRRRVAGAVPGAFPERPRAPGRGQARAPGQGPGVATSGSSSTLVSKSVKPRRR